MDGANRLTVIAVVVVPILVAIVEVEVVGVVTIVELRRPIVAVVTCIVEFIVPVTRSGKERINSLRSPGSHSKEMGQSFPNGGSVQPPPGRTGFLLNLHSAHYRHVLWCRYSGGLLGRLSAPRPLFQLPFDVFRHIDEWDIALV